MIDGCDIVQQDGMAQPVVQANRASAAGRRLSPLSGWMKPKPFAVLKNLTVPVVRMWESFPDRA